MQCSIATYAMKRLSYEGGFAKSPGSLVYKFTSNSTDKPARLIIRLLFEFAFDSVFAKPNQSRNSETAILSKLNQIQLVNSMP